MSDLAILGGAPVRTQPFPSWPQDGPDDRDRLLEVLESRNWGGYSFPNRYADEFAQKFAAAHGAEYGCCVANGALALVAALQAAAIRFDEVIVPAYTRDGASVTVLFAGAVPVFCDVGPATCCLDIDHVPESLTPRAKAVIPVHLAMRFADMDTLVALGVERDLFPVRRKAGAARPVRSCPGTRGRPVRRPFLRTGLPQRTVSSHLGSVSPDRNERSLLPVSRRRTGRLAPSRLAAAVPYCSGMPALAGAKIVSRAERSRLEKERNY
jgi:hypothetical protein